MVAPLPLHAVAAALLPRSEVIHVARPLLVLLFSHFVDGFLREEATDQGLDLHEALMHFEHELLLCDFFLKWRHLGQLCGHGIETWAPRILDAVQIVVIGTLGTLLFLRVRFGKGIRHWQIVNQIVCILQLLPHHLGLGSNSHLLVHIVSWSLIVDGVILLLVRLEVPREWLLLLVKLLEELLVLNDCSLLSFLLLLLRSLFCNNLRCWHTREIIERSRLEPAVRDVQLPLDLLPHSVHFVDGEDELRADRPVVILCESPALVLSEIVSIETVLEREGVRDLKLLPGDDTRCSDLVWFDSEPAIPIVEHVRLLRKYPWKQPHDGPAEEAAVRRGVATIEKRIVLFRVAMQVAVNPDVPLVLLFDRLHELLHCADLGVEALLWIDPLPVQVDACQRVPVIATYDSIWIHHRYEYKSVEPSQVLGFSKVGRQEIVDASKYLTARRLSGVNSRRDQDRFVLERALVISSNYYLLQRQA